jgi:hypothetical protein
MTVHSIAAVVDRAVVVAGGVDREAVAVVLMVTVAFSPGAEAAML